MKKIKNKKNKENQIKNNNKNNIYNSYDYYMGKYHKNLNMKSEIKNKMEENLHPKQITLPLKVTNNYSKDDPNSNRQNRIKAYNIMNNVFQSKNNYSKINNNIKINNNNYNNDNNINNNNNNKYKILNKKDDDYYLKMKYQLIEEKTLNDQIKQEDLINSFEKYYEEKFSHLEKNPPPKGKVIFNEADFIEKTTLTPDVQNYYKINQLYFLGANLSSKSKIKNSQIKYNKDDKWIAYLNKNYIIIESFSPDLIDRQQIILSSHKINNNLISIKLSNAGRILYALSEQNEIVFYNYKQNNFSYLNKFICSCSFVNDYCISPLNNICIILYDDFKIVCIDFVYGEELLKSESIEKKNGFMCMKFNDFMTSNNEFCSINQKNFSVWNINIKELKIEEKQSKLNICDISLYNHSKYNFNNNNNNDLNIICFDYIPPITIRCLMCLIFVLSNGDIIIIDYINDKFLKHFKSDEVFLKKNIKIFDIVCSMYYTSIIYDDRIKYYLMPSLQKIDYNNIELFKTYRGEIKNKSTIISCDIDINNPKTEGISLTNNGSVYYFNYNEQCTVRLFTFIPEEIYKINQVKILNKDIKKYGVGFNNENNDNNNNNENNINNNDKYYLITSHLNGNVRIWTIPSFDMIYVFEVKDDLILIETLPNDLKFLAFYKSGNIRCFDIEKGKVIGKINIKNVLGENNYFKEIIFFPDSKNFFGIDNEMNNIFLGTVEKYEKLSIHFNQIILNNMNNNIKRDLKLSVLDSYTIFGLIEIDNNNNWLVNVYNRKYTELIHDLTFDNSIPVFSKIDVVDVKKFLVDNNFNIDNNVNNNNYNIKNNNLLIISFSPIENEKNLILVYSRKYNILIAKDFREKIYKKVIKFDQQLNSFKLSFFGNYILYIFNNILKASEYNPNEYTNIPKGTLFPTFIKNNLNFPIISQDDKIFVVYDKNSLIFYLISL